MSSAYRKVKGLRSNLSAAFSSSRCTPSAAAQSFKENYYNRHRTHDALDGVTPAMRAELTENKIIDLNKLSLEVSLSRALSDTIGGIDANWPGTGVLSVFACAGVEAE
jgi:hypothetical protein